jgi:hypothetical protein
MQAEILYVDRKVAALVASAKLLQEATEAMRVSPDGVREQITSNC